MSETRKLATILLGNRLAMILIATFLALAGAAAAGPLEDGDAAFKRGHYATALQLWRSLADKGNPYAQFKLGVMYEDGEGVPQDYVYAHMWFNLAAAEEGDPVERVVAASGRDEVAAKMSPDQIAEAQRLAREWKPTK